MTDREPVGQPPPGGTFHRRFIYIYIILCCILYSSLLSSHICTFALPQIFPRIIIIIIIIAGVLFLLLLVVNNYKFKFFASLFFLFDFPPGLHTCILDTALCYDILIYLVGFSCRAKTAATGRIYHRASQRKCPKTPTPPPLVYYIIS